VHIDDLTRDLRVMLGNLRGQDPPRAETMRRLRDINPFYRVTYSWPTPDKVVSSILYAGQPAFWWLHFIRPNSEADELRKRAAFHRLERYRKFGKDRQDKNLGLERWCEDAMLGYHTVGNWPTHSMSHVAGFGSDPFFEELARGEALFREEKKALEQQVRLDQAADHDSLQEATENSAYREELRKLYRLAAADDYELIFKGRKSVTIAHSLKEQTDGAHRQQIHRPGQDPEGRERQEPAPPLVA